MIYRINNNSIVGRNSELYENIDNDLKDLLRNNYRQLKIDYIHVGQIGSILFRDIGRQNNYNFITEFNNILNGNGCTVHDSDVSLHGHYNLIQRGRGRNLAYTRTFRCIHFKIEEDNNETYIGWLNRDEIDNEFTNRMDEILHRARIR